MQESKNQQIPSKEKCSQDCACSSEKETKLDVKTEAKTSSTAEIKLDPTHFGDWQVNCRAIDF